MWVKQFARLTPSASRLPIVPPRLYRVTQRVIQSPDLPVQTVWGFDEGVRATSPGPTYRANYGIPQLTRNINGLPPWARMAALECLL